MPAPTPWVTAAQVRHLFAHNPDRPGWFDPDSIDDTEIEQAVANAQAEVTAKVSARYAAPTDPALVPELLRSITGDVAVYLLALQQRTGEIPDDDVVVLRYRRAVDLLDGIAVGRYGLPAVDDGDGLPGSAAGSGGTPKVLNPYEGRLVDMADFGLGYEHAWQRL